LQALDFQKHYRMPAVYLMDPDRSFERQHNSNGWPFLMLADDNGEIVYQCNNLADRDKTFLRHLQNIVKTQRHPQIQSIGGIPYLRSTLENNGESEKILCNERFTSTACDPNGVVYTVYTAVEDGNSNVYLKMQREHGEPETIPAAAGEADEYDGTVITDTTGRVWVCWTSNRLGHTYNIYLSSLTAIRNNKLPVLISQSKEDVMHGRMAVDASNAVWVTYYKWQKLNNTSRDKEVYVRKYANGTVSKEIHVSPEDVSAYEDHTDPVIAILNDQPVVCWSWDFHQPEGYTKDAETPTIFARSVNEKNATQKPFHISAKRIDMTPVLASCGDSLWCAWDSLGRNKKSLCVREITEAAASGAMLSIAEDVVNACSPNFAFYKNSKGVLTWSQTENGKDWSLWKADFDVAAKKWATPAKIITDGNPRFSSCAYDPQGRLWLAYSVQTESGRKIKIEQLNEHGNRTDH
jgi:hypothetical protein